MKRRFLLECVICSSLFVFASWQHCVAQDGYESLSGTTSGGSSTFEPIHKKPSGSSGLEPLNRSSGRSSSNRGFGSSRPLHDDISDSRGLEAPDKSVQGSSSLLREDIPEKELKSPSSHTKRYSGSPSAKHVKSTEIDANKPLFLMRETPEKAPSSNGKHIAGDAFAVGNFPVRTLFNGLPEDNWKMIGVAGGNFKKFGRFENGRMVVSVPAKHSWGKTGILSEKPVLDLDYYTLARAPYIISVKVDPKKTSGFVIAFDGSKNPDMWPSHRLWIQVGKSKFLYHTSFGGGKSGKKPESWDGWLNIEIGAGWFSVQPSGGETLRDKVNMKPGQKFFISVISHPDKEYQPSSLTLESITLQKKAPNEMSALERCELAADADFDVKTYRQALATRLLEGK